MSISRVIKVDEHPNTILTNLKSQRELKEHCDVTIKVGDRLFHAHKNVLAAGSDYFNKMFSTEMKEKYQKTVTIGDVTPGAVEKVFDFLYSDEIELSTNNVKNILHAASVMQVPDLLVAINDFLSDVVNTPNCLNFRELGRFYSLDNLSNKSHRCILDNFEKVSKQTEFTDLTLVYLEEILKSDDLMVTSESIVFEALVRWTMHSFDERKDLFPKLFKHVRLQLISAEYISTNVSKEPLVREFHVCRDMVDEAFRFHLNLNEGRNQHARKGQQTEIHSVALFSKTNCLHIFNFDSKQWSYITHQNMVTPIGSMVTFHANEIFIFLADNNRRFSIYSNGDWRNETTIPNIRVWAQAVYVNDMVYIIGGQNFTNGTISNNVSAYDFTSKTWKTVCNLRSPRCAMVALVYKDEIFVLGGYTDYGMTQVCCLVEVLNPVSKTWNQMPNMNTERANFGAVVFGDRIYAFGGMRNNNTAINTVEFMDVEESVWTNLTTDIPVELGANSACCVGNRIVVLGKENVLLSFDPCTATWKVESQVPPSVQGAKLVTWPWNEDLKP